MVVKVNGSYYKVRVNGNTIKVKVGDTVTVGADGNVKINNAAGAPVSPTGTNTNVSKPPTKVTGAIPASKNRAVRDHLSDAVVKNWNAAEAVIRTNGAIAIDEFAWRNKQTTEAEVRKWVTKALGYNYTGKISLEGYNQGWYIIKIEGL